MLKLEYSGWTHIQGWGSNTEGGVQIQKVGVASNELH